VETTSHAHIEQNDKTFIIYQIHLE